MSGVSSIEKRLEELTAKGDFLEKIKQLVDFEIFREDLEKAVPRKSREKGGRPAFDHVLMFKILLLQTYHNLSDERTEFLLRDRLTFMRFLGLGLSDRVPDANTIWLFREALTKTGAIEALFRRFGVFKAGRLFGNGGTAYRCLGCLGSSTAYDSRRESHRQSGGYS